MNKQKQNLRDGYIKIVNYIIHHIGRHNSVRYSTKTLIILLQYTTYYPLLRFSLPVLEYLSRFDPSLPH